MSESKALERLRPQEQALMQVAEDLGIVHYSPHGAMLIDLGNEKLKEQYNVLAPATTLAKADANFTPAISVVNLDTKDFYPTGKGDNTKYALSKVQLDQIAKVAGIEDIGPTIVYFGTEQQNLRVTWTARMRRPDGTWQIALGTREWIEADEREKLLASPPQWVLKDGPPDNSNPTFNKWWADNWLGIIKKHRMGNTETKARLRAYRSLLTVKGGYTKQEMSKPFLIASTSFTPDTSDLRILGMLMGQGQEAANTLYGEPRQLESGAQLTEAISRDDEIDDEIDEDTATAVVDTETGEIIEGEVVEESTAEQTFGPKPEMDLEIPRGPHKGKMLSEITRTDRNYVEETILKSSNADWGLCAEAWLRYIYGDEGNDDIGW